MTTGNVFWAAGDGVTPEIIVRDLKFPNLAKHTEAICIARRLLREQRPPAAAMLDAGLIAPLLDALDKDDCPEIRHEALAVLSNIAFLTREHTLDVINNGVLPKLITFLASEDDLVELAILALGSFALHGAEAQRGVLARGAVTAMLPYLRTDTPVRRLRTCVRALSNFCSLDDDDIINFELVSPVLPYIHDILDIENEESLDPDDKEIPYIARDIVVDACTALTNIMHGPDECIEAVQAVPGLTARLVALLGHEASAVRGAALSAVGNMLAGTDEQVDRCLEANCLDHIVSFFESSNNFLVKEAARATGNVLAGTHSQIQLALEKDILHPLRNILANGDPESRKQAVLAITSLCHNGTAAHKALIALSDVVQLYCAVLMTSDLETTEEVLDGLDQLMQVADQDGYLEPLCYMLDECEVLDQIQTLQECNADEGRRCKLANMSATLRKHAREERCIIFEDKVFTSKTIVQDLMSSHLETKTRACCATFQCILLEMHPPINAFLEAGIMAPVVESLDTDASPDLQCMGVWTIYNITSKTDKHRKAVVDSGAISKLLALLARGDEIAHLASCSLSNIALHGPETRDAVLAYVQSEAALTEFRTYLRAYKNMCSIRQDNPELTEEQIKEMFIILKPRLRAVPLVSVLLDIEDREILAEASRACTNLMFAINTLGDHAVEAIRTMSGLTARLVDLLGHAAVEVQGNALLALGNMFAHSCHGNLALDTEIDRCLDHFISFLHSNEPWLVEQACVVVCNMVNHKHSPLQKVLEKDILTPLQHVLAHAELNCQKQAARLISIICDHAPAVQHARLVSRSVLQPYSALLAAPDLELVEYVLHGLGILLQKAEGDSKLKHLCLKLNRIGVLDLLQQLLMKDIDKDLQHKAEVVSATLRKEVKKENLVIEDRKLFTLAEIVQELQSRNLPTQMRAVSAACRILYTQHPPRTAMIEAGIVAPLVAALDRRDCPDLQSLAAAVLVCITQGTHKHRVAIVNGGAIPKLVAMLAQESKVAEPAAVVLASISHRALVSRDKVLSHGAVRAMLPHLRRDTPLELLRMCVAAYKNLCVDIVTKSTLDEVLPALPSMANLLDMEDHSVLIFACGAIGNLVSGSEDRMETVCAVPGLTARLVALLGHEASAVRGAALSAVGNILIDTDDHASRCCLDIDCLEYIVPLLQCSEPSLVQAAAKASYNMLLHAPSIQRALEKDIVTPLINILAYAEPNSHLQYHVVGALANIATLGTPEHRLTIAYGGAIPKLVALAAYEAAVAGQAITALGHLADNGVETRDLVLAHGAVRAMLPHMRAGSPTTLLATCAWAYGNFCRHKEGKPMENLEVVLPALPYISELLLMRDEQVQASACQAFNKLMQTNECIEAVQAVPGLTARLVALLGHEADIVKSEALMAVMLMLSGTDAQAYRCLEAGCLDQLLTFFHCREPFRIVAMRAMRNFLNHSGPYVHRAIERGILTPLLKLLANAEPNSFLQSNVVGALSNITSFGTNEHLKAVVDGGAIPKLVDLLSHRSEIAELAAGALANIAWLGSNARDLVLAHGAVRAMLPHLRADSPLELLRKCVQAYRNFCRHDDSNPKEKVDLVLPALPYISELLGFGDDNVVENACHALVNLAKTHEGIEAVQAVPGLAARLAVLLGHEASDVKKAAIVAVCLMLSGTNTQVDRCLNAGCLDCVLPVLESSEPYLVELALRAAGIILCHTQSHFQEALEKDIITPLLNILADGGVEPNSARVYFAVNLLAIITERGTPEHRMSLINGGAVPNLVALLSHEAAVAEPAAVAIGCLAGDGPETRDLVLAHGAMRAMLPYMRADAPLELLTKCVAAYRNFCRHDDDKRAVKLELVSPALPQISELLGVSDQHVLEDACLALAGLARSREGCARVCGAGGLAARLAALLRHAAATVRGPATAAVMTILWTLYSGTLL